MTSSLAARPATQVALAVFALLGPQLGGAESDEARASRIAANRAWSQSLPAAPAPALTSQPLIATELARWPVRGANQGVAVDDTFFYGIGNFALVKHRKDTGERVAEWVGLKGGPFVHLNGGYVSDKKLILAHSNFPQLPMASSLETFDTTTLAHVATRSFGIRLGSLTWAERRDGFWWARPPASTTAGPTSASSTTSGR
jgi:hypothetical protein